MTDQNTRPTPSTEELKDLIHEALQDSMDVDWSTSVGAEHVARALTEAGFLTRPTPSSDVAAIVEKLTHAIMTLPLPEGGAGKRAWQSLVEARDAISRLSTPAQVEVTDENAFTVTICAAGDNETTAQEAIHHGLAYAHRAGYITAWTDPVAALTATDAKPVVPAEPVAVQQLEPDGGLTPNFVNGAGVPRLWAAKGLGHRFLYAAPPSPVEGSALLPVEPDDGMIEAGEEEIACRRQHGMGVFAADIYEAMVRAYLASEGKTDA